MRMLIANLDAGTAIEAPSLTLGTLGDGTQAGKTYYYAVCPQTVSVNSAAEVLGRSTYNSEGLTASGNTGTTFGTAIRLTWGTLANVGTYYVFKGTATTAGNYSIKAYAIISGTLGTYIDITPSAVGTGIDLGSVSLSYPQGLWLPQASTYTPSFVNKSIQHDLINNSMIVFNKPDIYTAQLGYEQISDTDMTDMRTVYNWHSEMRFFPNADEKPQISFDVEWISNFDFQLTTHNINQGYNGAIGLKSTTPLSSITEVV